MCNNPSYERPVISFQFAFVSVLLSVLSQGSAPTQTQGLHLSRQVWFSSLSPVPAEIGGQPCSRCGHLGTKNDCRVRSCLVPWTHLLIEGPDTPAGRGHWFHSPRTKGCGARRTLYYFIQTPCFEVLMRFPSSSLVLDSHLLKRQF